MAQFRENISLRTFNTFGINTTARWFSTFANLEELSALLGFTEDRQLSPIAGATNSPIPGVTTSPRRPLKLKGRTSGLSPLLILGGGSNILFTRDFDGLVLKNEIRG